MDLWHDLIDFSIDKPYFVHVLLHNIGTHVDPRILIERIEAGREIPGLRDSLVQIMHDYQLQVIFFFFFFHVKSDFLFGFLSKCELRIFFVTLKIQFLSHLNSIFQLRFFYIRN